MSVNVLDVAEVEQKIIIKTRDLIRVTVNKLDQKTSNNLQIWMATMKSRDRSLIHQIHQIHQILTIDPSFNH